MPSPRPRVFNIPACAPFLKVLIEALRARKLVPGFPASSEPLELARATLYLPTRRACALARDVFLETLGGNAAILPRIVPLGHIDEDEINFARFAGADATDIELPETLGEFHRKITLTELILNWAKSEGMRAGGGATLVANSPAAAFKLAGDLAHLMDDMATRQVPWDKFDGLVPDELDEYWQKTIAFLKIARDAWPNFLAENNLLEPATRQNKLIAAEAERLKQSGAPVIAAGSTGSIPATAELLSTIARLPHGAVVLPGLDTELDDDAWHALGEKNAAPGHPQFAMAALLRRFGIDRSAVESLAAPGGRELLVSEAMRPAEQTDRWNVRLAEIAPHAEAAMKDIAAIEAANSEEEALAIAVALRETVEDRNKIAALITPDRSLARRVLAALARWNIEAEDSAGDDLADMPAGVFARLVAEAAFGGVPPVPLLAMLKHPLCALDASAVEALESAILRGPRPKPGTSGLAHTLATFRATRDELHPSDPRTRLTEAELDSAQALVAQLTRALAPLEMLKPGVHTLAAIAQAHRAVIEELAGEQEDLSEFFDDIVEHGALAIARDDYAELLHAALAGRPVVRPHGQARIRILGTLESRLQRVDRAVLGGLAEGIWPPEPATDPWLSRPMRQQLGLDLPERRIGLSAHDFAQALGAKEIVLTRAAKVGGAPTVISRFVQRLAAVAGERLWDGAIARGKTYIDYARMLDEPEKSERIKMPAPTPPLAARPKQLSVTDIENWLRDPYTIYAKHVLRLVPLEDVDTPPGAADRGTIIHAAIGEFAQKFPGKLPDDAFAQMLSLGEKHFADVEDFPDAKAFWWPRFMRIAHWLTMTFEPGRRAGVKSLNVERYAKMPITLANGTFTLTARADRIEQLNDGTFAILDFKTGKPPSDGQVQSGLSPQLTLEAAMLRGGAFNGIPKGADVSQLVYVSLRGGDPAGEDRIVKFKDSDANAQADHALGRLIGVAAKFAELTTAYRPLAHPMWSTHYGDYDHLARVKEWSLTGGADEGGE
ncbi:MAG TPA: double-strand break repair protein AddB [Pseudolabrys sp.]|nr:double-strand break repair protein AddB [Pseudolabrys sp.]